MEQKAWELLLHNIDDINKEIHLIDRKLDKLSLDVHTLKLKSGIWGLTGGAGGASIIGILVKLFT
jgi:hypothetical protein